MNMQDEDVLYDLNNDDPSTITPTSNDNDALD